MSQLSPQALYDKIKNSSKSEYTLKEMKHLGFWLDDKKPHLDTELATKQIELQAEINQLSQQINNPQAALNAIHQQRMTEARQRRVDTKVKKELKRYQRAIHWYQRKQGYIDYLGNACVVSRQQNNQQQADSEKLKAQQLPICETAANLAEAMGVTLNEVRFLCYTDEVSKVTHYQRFAIHKKTGGVRLISAPMPRLKRLQYWILDNILQRIPLSAQAHGFVPLKSIVTNATPHTRQKVVINMDLKNFFPTISYPRIKGLFAKQGYGNEVATLLALLCSEPETETVEMDGQRYYIHNKQRYLPQGAPSSPMISNILCRRLDARLQGLATKYDFVYTRYADDLTFSSSQTGAITALLNWTKSIVKEEGFVLHPDKTRIMHQGARQEVTGIVVNNQLSVNRKQLKQFRALLFQIKKDGYAGKQWGNKGGDLLATISGFAHYVKMVNPSKGKQFLHQIEAIKALHGRSSADHNFAWSDTDFRQKAANAELPLATMQVAQAPPVPDINSIIQHRDVLDSVKKELGIEEEVATKSPALSASIAKQDSDHTQKQQKTIFSRIKSWFGGAS